MRRYYLASVVERENVDLRLYEEEIKASVHQFMPKAQVVVEKDYYSVHPTPERGNAIRIGRVLSSKDVLGRYCVKIPKLFCSEEVEKGMVSVNGTEEKCVGGHQ